MTEGENWNNYISWIVGVGAFCVLLGVLIKIIYIARIRSKVRQYNRHVDNSFRELGIPVSMFIVRCQNEEIKQYNRQCNSIVGRILFRKMEFVTLPKQEKPKAPFCGTRRVLVRKNSLLQTNNSPSQK